MSARDHTTTGAARELPLADAYTPGNPAFGVGWVRNSLKYEAQAMRRAERKARRRFRPGDLWHVPACAVADAMAEAAAVFERRLADLAKAEPADAARSAPQLSGDAIPRAEP